MHAARPWTCILLALGLLAGCDEPPGEDAGAVEDEVVDLADEPGPAQGGYADGTDYAEDLPKCCYALCQGAGSYVQVSDIKKTCQAEAAEFCALWNSYDPTVGPLVDYRWLYCG